MRVMIYEGPKKLKIAEADDLSLKDNEIRIKTLYSGISHGTEMTVYRGLAPFFKRRNVWSIRLFRPAEESEIWRYPIRSCDPNVWYMGYANVGRVVEKGGGVKGLNVGDIVYANAPHQSHVIKPEDQVVKLPDGIEPETGIFFTNLMTAYNGILDTRIKLGDSVAVSGLGVIGLLALHMAKISGAFRVYGIDTLDRRLEAAKSFGADEVFNPLICSDIAFEIRKLTCNKGVDAVIDASGNIKSLNESIRMAAPDTTVTALGWYQGQCTDLNLSEEFHHNRIALRSSQTVFVDPQISHMWNTKRKESICLELLGRLKLSSLITHRIPFEHASEAYELIDRMPQNVIQVALLY